MKSTHKTCSNTPVHKGAPAWFVCGLLGSGIPLMYAMLWPESATDVYREYGFTTISTCIVLATVLFSIFGLWLEAGIEKEDHKRLVRKEHHDLGHPCWNSQEYSLLRPPSRTPPTTTTTTVVVHGDGRGSTTTVINAECRHHDDYEYDDNREYDPVPKRDRNAFCSWCGRDGDCWWCEHENDCWCGGKLS